MGRPTRGGGSLVEMVKGATEKQVTRSGMAIIRDFHISKGEQTGKHPATA